MNESIARAADQKRLEGGIMSSLVTIKISSRLFYIPIVKTVPAAKFKAQCLALLDRVGLTAF
jgi:hypothetical protein